jgi:hypothetical protein
MFVWYWNNRLSWICIAIVHWNKSPRVLVDATLTHYPDSKQSSLFAPILLNAACLAEKLQISILQSLVWPKIICNGSKARKITLTDFWKFTWISIKNAFQLLGEKIYFQEKQPSHIDYQHILAPVFMNPVSSCICMVHVKIAKSLEKLRWRLLVCED